MERSGEERIRDQEDPLATGKRGEMAGGMPVGRVLYISDQRGDEEGQIT
jgi:hypothetical protein